MSLKSNVIQVAILNKINVLASKSNDSFSEAVIESIKATNKDGYIVTGSFR